MKIWLIQNIVSPYRIKLFRTISEKRGIEFKLILLSKGIRYLPQWNFQPKDLAFKAERVKGFVFYTGYENQICINPILLLKMIKEKPHIVICAGFSFATLLSLIYKMLFGGKYIIWNEGTYITEGKRSKLRIILRKFMVRFASGFVDAGTLSREYLKSLLPKADPKAFFRSYNCVESKKFKNNAFVNIEELNKFQLIYPEKNILFVGQLIERKGIIQLLESYKRVIKIYNEPVGLILIGSGPMASYIENYKEHHKMGNIYIQGFLNNDDLPRFYAFCKVFSLLSLFDPNPLVIFEALASGIPVICSNRAGNSVDFIIEGKNGYIVDPFDIDQVVSRIINVLNWEKRNECTAISRELSKKVNYEESAKAFIDACQYAISNKSI
jgi:glycosyltransferase involved in cell wall biosynthesis